MKLDLVYVTYNSEKWIDNCFRSVISSEVDKKDLSVYVVDNASTDGTICRLRQVRNQYKNCLKDFQIIRNKDNLGFGKANNAGFQKGRSEIVCFFNIDTEVYPETLKNLIIDIEKSDSKTALWELRQFPYEHPKTYNVLNHDTGWSSGAAFAVKREVYERAGGFDDAIFMYAEDVDLSWRIRSFGYRLKYVPRAAVVHYSYTGPDQIKPQQYINGIINNLLLRYRFGNFREICLGHLFVWISILKPEAFANSRRILWKAYRGHFDRIRHFRNGNFDRGRKNLKPVFRGFEYSVHREGAFYFHELLQNQPLVSIIIHTFCSPVALRETLISLKHQTYANLEILIVSAGGELESINAAISKAGGIYISVISDRVWFYADHIEVLVQKLESSKKEAAYTLGFKEKGFGKKNESAGAEKYRKINYGWNGVPVSCVMFTKGFYRKYCRKIKFEKERIHIAHEHICCIPKTTFIVKK